MKIDWIRFWLAWGLMMGLTLKGFSQKVTNRAPNIVFIAVDDLRPELGAYGAEYAHTPNLDHFASKSTVFKNHFVTVPTCGASRLSVLVGKLPKTKADLGNMAAVEQIAKMPRGQRAQTFIRQLRENGYYTVGIGKISHHPDGYVYGYDEPKSDILELPDSWDEMLLDHGKWGSGHNAFFGYADGGNRTDMKKQVKPYESADVPDEGYPDGLSANLAIKKLSELKDQEQPFFLGIGFFKPHLPFTAPKKYWDLYQESELPIAPFAAIPRNSSAASLIQSGEFNQYALGEEKASLDMAMSDDYARKIRHAYLASVSYVDAQIGKVLDELERQGLSENTIVVVWGDHGWHLGDDRVWGKHTLFNWALQSVLMIKSPSIEAAEINQIVSSVDLYPTLMELVGMDLAPDLDGQSMVDLMIDPVLKTWRNTAYSYYNQGNTVRTPEFRLTRYYRNGGSEYELYSQEKDPFETDNIFVKELGLQPALKNILEKGNTGIFEN